MRLKLCPKRISVIYLVTMRPRILRSLSTSRLAFWAILILLVPGITSAAQGTAGDEDQIRVILQKYATSVDNADVALASEIWSHDPAVTFIFPLGTAHGFQQIADEVYIGAMRNMFSKRELILHQPVIHVYADAAWSEMTWTFHATKKDGSPITSQGRETQVYHKEKGAWRVVHVHYSGPPIAMPTAPVGPESAH
jgi:ketosteroid isomerase-like protein